MKKVTFIESEKEPIVKAYKLGLKSYKEFYSYEDCAAFFKIRPNTAKCTARGYTNTHVVGSRINQIWFVFDETKSEKYITEFLKTTNAKKYTPFTKGYRSFFMP